MNLSTGSLQSILDGNNVCSPILKVLNFREISKDSSKRYRLSLTDGTTKHDIVMLNTELNEKIESKQLTQNTVVILDRYFVRAQGEKKVIVLVEITIVDQDSCIPEVGKLENKEIQEERKPLLNKSFENFMPINLLNSYQNKWVICGRVSQKMAIKTYKNQKGEGKVFNFILCDSTCDVKVIAFNNLVDKFFDMIQVGQTYSLSKGMVKSANVTFNNTKCDYEITLGVDSELCPIQNSTDIPKMNFQFVSIDEIAKIEPNTFIDVVGVAHSVMDISTITTKNATKEIIKRDVVFVDQSGLSIRLTLWSDDVHLLDNEINPVLVIKGVSVKEFSGRALSCGGNSMVLVNPLDVDEALSLASWYKEKGMSMTFQTQQGSTSTLQVNTKASCISQLVCESNSDKPGYFTVWCKISQIKQENFVYKSCITEKCGKKLVDTNNGLFRCERCNIESPDFKYRLILNMNIIDHTGSQWITAFQEVAELVLGKSALEIGNMVDLEKKEELGKTIKEALFKTFQFKLRAKNETYNDESRMKVVVVDGFSNELLPDIPQLISLIDV